MSELAMAAGSNCAQAAVAAGGMTCFWSWPKQSDARASSRRAAIKSLRGTGYLSLRNDQDDTITTSGIREACAMEGKKIPQTHLPISLGNAPTLITTTSKCVNYLRTCLNGRAKRVWEIGFIHGGKLDRFLNGA